MATFQSRGHGRLPNLQSCYTPDDYGVLDVLRHLLLDVSATELYSLF